MNRVADVLYSLRRKGVRVWGDNGQLRYQVQRGPLTPEDMASLRALRSEIIAFLEESSRAATLEPPLLPRVRTETVPLTYSQQLWWFLMQLGTHRSTRSIFVAVRLLGRLDLECLQACVTGVVCRHESLRTRIINVDGDRRQIVDPVGQCDLAIIDLTETAQRDREGAAARLVWKLATEPIDPAVDPLFAASLLKLGHDDYVLVLTMDHLIADVASAAVLLRDLWAIYLQLLQKVTIHLAPMPVQFPDYAVWQHRVQSFWTERFGAYWLNRLHGAQHVPLFADDALVGTSGPRFGRLPVCLGESLSVGLRELGRRERTSLAMTVLCAYVALVFRWCDRTDVVVPFLTTGRSRPELENMVGFLASRLFLRFDLRADDTFIDLLTRITSEYAAAYEHDDLGRIAARTPAPQFARNCTFNWFPPEFDASSEPFMAQIDNSPQKSFDPGLRLQPFSVEAFAPPDLEWRDEPGLLLADTSNGVTGIIAYPADRINSTTVQRFASNLRFFAERMVHQPSTRLAGLSCQA